MQTGYTIVNWFDNNDNSCYDLAPNQEPSDHIIKIDELENLIEISMFPMNSKTNEKIKPDRPPINTIQTKDQHSQTLMHTIYDVKTKKPTADMQQSLQSAINRDPQIRKILMKLNNTNLQSQPQIKSYWNVKRKVRSIRDRFFVYI